MSPTPRLVSERCLQISGLAFFFRIFFSLGCLFGFRIELLKRFSSGFRIGCCLSGALILQHAACNNNEIKKKEKKQRICTFHVAENEPPAVALRSCLMCPLWVAFFFFFPRFYVGSYCIRLVGGAVWTAPASEELELFWEAADCVKWSDTTGGWEFFVSENLENVFI